MKFNGKNSYKNRQFLLSTNFLSRKKIPIGIVPIGIPIGIPIGNIPIGKIPIRISDKIPIGIFPIGIPIGIFPIGIPIGILSEILIGIFPIGVPIGNFRKGGQMHHSSSYVAGYLAAQALKNHQCSACKESLVNPNLDSSCQRLRHLLD